MMADNNNIYFFPRTCGPLLIEYYSKLLKEPIPQQLKDLLSMLEEASGSADSGTSSEPEARDQTASREPQPDTPGGKPR
jgi:hypothetical protein